MVPDSVGVEVQYGAGEFRIRRLGVRIPSSAPRLRTGRDDSRCGVFATFVEPAVLSTLAPLDHRPRQPSPDWDGANLLGSKRVAGFVARLEPKGRAVGGHRYLGRESVSRAVSAFWACRRRRITGGCRRLGACG